VVSGVGAVTVRLSEVKPESVQWLWHGRLPLGKLVVLDGDPAVGKSTCAADFAARVSSGSAWPDGASCPRGSVVLLSAEDGLADTIRPRLDAAGADVSMVHALTDISYTDEDGKHQKRPVTLGDVEHIEQVVAEHAAKLVVVDVLMAFLPGDANAHRDQDVRRVLSQLSAMCERQNCCLVLLRHLNKAGGGSALYRGGGSIGIVGAARVGLLAALDPDDDAKRLLAVTKSNLAAKAPTLSYRLQDAPEHGCAHVAWLGASTRTADELVNTLTSANEQGSELSQFLVALLEEHDGTIAAKDAQAALRDAGYPTGGGILDRAKKRAKVASRKAPGGLAGGWVWTFEESAMRPKAPQVPAPEASDPSADSCPNDDGYTASLLADAPPPSWPEVPRVRSVQ
jgi:hypothetical protein